MSTIAGMDQVDVNYAMYPLQNRTLGLALEREKQKSAGLSAELQKAQTIGNVPLPGSSDPQVSIHHAL